MRRCTPLVAATAAAVLLAACGTPDNAYRVMREQQALQQALRTEESRTQAASAAGEAEVYLSFIERTQREGSHYAALAHLQAYRQRFGDSPAVALIEADALRATGQHAASAAAYRAMLVGPNAGAAWHGLGLIAAAEGDYARAADDLARAAAMRPTDPAVLGDLGYARLRAGDIAGARVPIAQAAELDPGNAKALANLALLLRVQGDRAGAEAVMARAGLSAPAREAVEAIAAEFEVAGVSLPGAMLAAPPAMPLPDLGAAPMQSMLERFTDDPTRAFP